MISIDNNRKIVFDMESWLKLDGETGPYLQYVYARINSLYQKLGPIEVENEIKVELLSSLQEEALLLQLAKFNTIILSAANQFKAMTLCSYLYDLGKLFNSFYAECSIGKAETKELKNARLALAHVTGMVMGSGLRALGIPNPSRM